MEYAALWSHFRAQFWQTVSGFGFTERRIDCGVISGFVRTGLRFVVVKRRGREKEEARPIRLVNNGPRIQFVGPPAYF